jgi:hypothetical protein
MNDALMVGIVLALVFGSVIFYLYNRLSMAERKMGLVEGVLTDLKIMMDSAPFASGPPPAHMMREFEPTPEYLNAISGPVPLQKEEVEEVDSGADEDYQQTLEQALESAAAQGAEGSAQPYKTLHIDEAMNGLMAANANGSAVNPVSVTKLSPDLESMTVKELNTVAKQRGVNVPAGTRRKDLIELLRAAPQVQGTMLAQADLDGPAPPVEGAALDGSDMQVTL